MKKYTSAITIGFVCFALTISIFIQVKTINEAKNTVELKLSDNAGLIDEILLLQEQYDRTRKNFEKAEENLELVRNVALQESSDSAESVELKENNKLLGLTKVKGEGIIITLDENKDTQINETVNANKLLVHEGDLLHIVNELFNAGADAVSINEQRIVGTTAILCDGNIVRINGEIVGVPITIKAIGHQGALANLFRPQGYLQLMANDGIIVSWRKSSEVIIPEYKGVYSNNYITRGDIN